MTGFAKTVGRVCPVMMKECTQPDECNTRDTGCAMRANTLGFLAKAPEPEPITIGTRRLNLYDFLRAGHVKRWHIINTGYAQSLAEHTFLVVLIAIELYHVIVGGEGEDGGRELLRVIMAAIFHDMPETRTGDIPTPSKHYICDQIKAWEEGPDVFERIERDLMPEVPYIGGGVAVALTHFVEMADVIEASTWIEQNGVGAHAKLVSDRMRIRMERKIAELTEATGVDWYGPVNRVLMAFGTLPAHRETELRAL